MINKLLLIAIATATSPFFQYILHQYVVVNVCFVRFPSALLIRPCCKCKRNYNEIVESSPIICNSGTKGMKVKWTSISVTTIMKIVQKIALQTEDTVKIGKHTCDVGQPKHRNKVFYNHFNRQQKIGVVNFQNLKWKQSLCHSGFHTASLSNIAVQSLWNRISIQHLIASDQKPFLVPAS